MKSLIAAFQVLFFALPISAHAVTHNDLRKALEARWPGDYGYLHLIVACELVDPILLRILYTDMGLPLPNHRAFRLGERGKTNLDFAMKEIFKWKGRDQGIHSNKQDLVHYARHPLTDRIVKYILAAMEDTLTTGNDQKSDKLHYRCQEILSTFGDLVHSHYHGWFGPGELDALKEKLKKAHPVLSRDADSKHSECLDARDYEGCIRVKSSATGSLPQKQRCAGEWCIADSGNDILGMPKIEGWLIKSDPATRTVTYRRPGVQKVLVRGQTGRHLAEESVVRYYQPATPGISPKTTTIGNSNTNCTSFTENSFNCTTTSPTTITTPGRAAMPGGVVQSQIINLIDCKENTVGFHVDNILKGKWEPISGKHFEIRARDNCSNVESLELSGFTKYAVR